MATIKANGGAAGVFEHPQGLRVVLCRNGKVLTATGGGAYHHAQNRKLAGLVGKPAAEQQAALAGYGFSPAASNASVTASTTIAAHWHAVAKHSRALRRRAAGERR